MLRSTWFKKCTPLRKTRQAKKLPSPLALEILEERSTPAVFTWTGSADHDWFNSANWSSDMSPDNGTPNIPDAGDSAIFNNGAAAFATNSAPVTLTTLTVSDGTLNLGAGIAVDTANFSAGMGTVSTGSSALTISNELQLSSANAVISSGNTIAVQGSNVVTDAVSGPGSRSITLSGGTMTLDGVGLGIGGLISSVTATSNDNHFAPASNTVNWNDGLMSTPTPDKAATQGGSGTDYQKMWTPQTGTSSYIQFDLGASYTLSEIYLWQYNQGGLSNRSIQTANIYFANTYPGQAAKIDPTGWTPYNPNNFPWPQSTGAGGDHTVVDMQNIFQTVRYVEIDPTSAWLNSGDVQGGLSKTLFYDSRANIDFPNTTIASTPNSTSAISIANGTAATTFGHLQLAGGTSLTLNATADRPVSIGGTSTLGGDVTFNTASAASLTLAGAVGETATAASRSLGPARCI